MELFTAIGEWISSRESLLSGIAALIVLFGVVASAFSFIYRRVVSARAVAIPTDISHAEPRITLKDLSAQAPFPIRFAESDGLRIAYGVTGQGKHDILVAPGMISHLNISSHLPPIRDSVAALGAFARIVSFDKRGQGLSDPSVSVPTLDERVHDIEAVMDAAGIERVILYGVSEGGPMCLKFAHDHPERVKGVVLLGTTAVARVRQFADSLT